MSKYLCDVCGWYGNIPVIYDLYEDGGYPVCPNTECYIESQERKSDGGYVTIREPSPAYLNPASDKNAELLQRLLNGA